MALWFRRCATFEEEAEADRDYWRQFSADERLALVEDLRRDWMLMSSDPPPSRDFLDFLRCLRNHDVRALVVGAHALAVHAKPRYTATIEVFVDRVDALETVPGVDVMTRIDGLSFEEAWPHRVEASYGGERAFFIGKADLIRNKEAAARPQDLADADLLRRS